MDRFQHDVTKLVSIFTVIEPPSHFVEGWSLPIAAVIAAVNRCATKTKDKSELLTRRSGMAVLASSHARGCLGGVGVLRLRRPIRFAHRSAPLRMTG
jgi:hypothetical protein